MVNKIKENKDLIITIGINIFMPIVYFFIFISSLFAILYLLIWAIDNDLDNPKINIKILVVIIVCLLYFMIFILRLCILPYWYLIIEKKSQNIILKNFINNLKHNIWYRLVVLIVVEIPFLFLIFLTTHNTIPPYKDFFPLLLTLPFVCDLLGCYLALFLWWDIQKLITKHKNEFSKCKNL